MKLTLRRDTLLLAFDAWWLLFIVLVTTRFNQFQLLNIVGFISLCIIPGALLAASMRLRLSAWEYLSFSVGLSLLTLIGAGLAGNTLLPLIGIARPLEDPFLLGTVSTVVVLLAFIAWLRSEDAVLHIPAVSLRECLYILVPLAFVCMSVLGALSLNNAGSNALTLAMLIGIAGYFIVLLKNYRAMPERIIPPALYCISLALLLMTSLRGWYITGHDIQREYLVFQLTAQNGLWSIGLLKDAYNACMSITILPTMFVNLLSFADPYIYKVLFQMLFAFVPPLLYLFMRRYLRVPLACLAVIYFLAFPTFFTDMPFLNRQEIAFIFLLLMFYILTLEAIPLRKRQWLFVMFGAGMVLSHYSTTYTVIFALLFLAVARFLVPLVQRVVNRYGWFSNSALLALAPGRVDPRRITLLMIAVIVAMSFVWTSLLTDTSSNSLYRVIAETVATIKSNTKEDAKSSDTLYGLFSWQSLNTAQEFAQYQAQTVAPQRAQDSAAFYPASSYAQYSLQPSTPELLPITALGRALERAGVNVPQFNYEVRQLSAKLLQVFIIIGLVIAVYNRRFVYRLIDSEFLLMAGGNLLLVLSIIVLPVLSVEYGLLRAFQQALFFLGLFVVVGSAGLFAYFGERRALMITGALAILFFLSSTGVFTQLTGGYDPQLHLNNSGSYYDQFYVHAQDIAAISWLTAQMQADAAAGGTPALQTTDPAALSSPALDNFSISSDIYPGLVQKNAYVLLGYTNIMTQTATISYNSDTIPYRYPAQFLDTQKDLLYDNGSTRIYR